MPRIAPSRGTHLMLDQRRPADRARRLHRPGRRGADDLRPALVRAHPGRHHRQRLRGRHRPRPQPGRRTTSSTCSTRSTRSSAPRSAAADLVGAYAGVRPLISTGDPTKSVDISRKAELYETSSGMLTITGGKLTTWRRMAKQTVDRLVEREGREAPCHTAEIPLGMAARAGGPGGAGGGRRGGASPSSPSATATPPATCSTLAGERPEAGGADRRRPPRPARRGRRSPPGASRRARVADVLLRRTRLGLLAAAAAARPPPSVRPVAEALGARAGLVAPPRQAGGRGLARRRRGGGRRPRPRRPRRLNNLRLR